MALRLKKAVPEFEEVDDAEGEENMWVLYDHPNPPMEHLNPLLRAAEAMVDPRKQGSYHLKIGAARRFVKVLGEGWGVENGRVCRVLPFGFEMSYKHQNNNEVHEAFYKNLRQWLEVNANHAAMKDVKGIHLFGVDKRPNDPKRGWLYICLPKLSSVISERGTFNGVDLKPEAADGKVHPRRFVNGISDRSNQYDFAIYAPQMIYVKMYITSDQFFHIIAEAILGGAQLAINFKGGSTDLKAWLKDGVKQHDASRAGLLEAEQKKREKVQADIEAASAKVAEKLAEKELLDGTIAHLSKKLSEKDIVKQYPQLASVKSVNRDDPYVTTIKTNDIVVNGVNLGEYQIRIQPDKMLVIVKASRDPKGVVHPNIYEEKGKWQWDLAPAKMQEMIQAMSTLQIHKVASIVIENLLEVAKDEVHDKRLAVLAEEIKVENEKAAKKADKKKVKEAPAKVAEGIEGDPIKEQA